MLFKMSCFLCQPCFNHTPRISIEDHDLSKSISIYDWKKRIRNLFIHVQIEWSTKYELLMDDIYEFYHMNIPFHNHTHAYDVLQLGIFLLLKCKPLFKKITFDTTFTFCLALLCHDIDHQGRTNSDLEKNGSFVDLECDLIDDSESLHSYCSSTSHNEKHHLSTACRLFKKHNVDYNKSLFATLVAHTDLLRHQTFLENLENKNTKNISIEDQLIVLMKLADIGHILRPWKVHMHFVNAMNRERTDPLSTLDLPYDTINFNATFVYPILLRLKQMNFVLYTKLCAKYEKNMQKWKDIRDFVISNQAPNH